MTSLNKEVHERVKVNNPGNFIHFARRLMVTYFRSYNTSKRNCVILRNPKGMETKLPMAATLRDTVVIALYSSLVDLLVILFGSM